MIEWFESLRPGERIALLAAAFFVVALLSALFGGWVDRNRAPDLTTAEFFVPNPDEPSTMPDYGEPVLAAYYYFGRYVWRSMKRQHAVNDEGYGYDKWIMADSAGDANAFDFGLPALCVEEPKISDRLIKAARAR